ncbi:uncharacterized protein LOC127719611 [Mytilus californianus]|uniref:uncharacterized protein LOC127719611 n=1 Tax=Mytilus californianus TaxID=6549 RepID=UPI0022479376|nr:uncharacterized protein LOC127719611 [Mytilus californianus]XP_052081797.1 uncharacterized protein LOC127719611 [Mytilus californianus]XP_052081798.1 uncharacterized protein LOC127719611 [Mytilus californianus]
MSTDRKGAKGKEKMAVSGSNFDSKKAAQVSGNQQHSGTTGSRPKCKYDKRKQATGTTNAGGQNHTVKLNYNCKQIKCMEKSDFFKCRIPPGIAVSIEEDTIELKGKDMQVLKLAKDNVERCKESLKLATLSIHSIQAQILKKSDVINFINECLDIDNLVVTWDVVEVADQSLLNVFSFDKQEAGEMIKKVMACIAEERVKIEETGLPWFQNLLRNEQSKLTITKSSAGDVLLYTTIDVREKYFVVNRRSKVNFSSSVGQQHASNQLVKATDSIDPTKQPSTANQQATPKDKKHKHKDSKEMEEKQAHESKETKTKNSAQVVKTSGILPPSHWFDMGNENFLKIAIKPGEDSSQKYEWENIQTKFESTLPNARIVSIQRIQNIFMWEHFYLKKRQFEHAYGKGCSNQLSLFHGTTPDMLDVIAEQNLDPRLAGDRMGARLGQGTYFAVSPEYSDLYAESDRQGHKFMFFANVLAGKSCIGKTDYKRPPMNPDIKPRLFDSCVDNVQNPKVYCIFHDTQYYLKYLIEYT